MTTSSTATKADRAEINRKNARKSTGPRSAEGKDRSRFNAVKHGLTSRTLVLPGEDPEALQLRLDGWIDSLKPKNELEHYLVERAVRVSWQLDRADRAEVARFAARIRDDEFRDTYRGVSVNVAALGRRLFWDRRGPLELYPHSPLKDQLLAHKQPRTSFSGLADDPDDPERLLIQLEALVGRLHLAAPAMGRAPRDPGPGPALAADRPVQGDPPAGPSAGAGRRVLGRDHDLPGVLDHAPAGEGDRPVHGRV